VFITDLGSPAHALSARGPWSLLWSVVAAAPGPAHENENGR